MTAESRSYRQIEAIAFLVHYRNLTLLLRERPFMTDLYSHLGKKRISVIFGERFSSQFYNLSKTRRPKLKNDTSNVL